MRKGHKQHARVSRSVNQRLKAAQKNAAKFEAERAAKEGEEVEDDESAPLGGDQEAVDDHSGGVSSDEEDVTETDDLDEDDSSLSTAADVTDVDFDDMDALREDEFSDEEYEELPNLVGEDVDEEELEEEGDDAAGHTKPSPVRRSSPLLEGYPLVEWEVLDVLGADDDWLPRWNIMANPPTLVLQDMETGQRIEMKLTRKVARDLDYSIHGITSIYEKGIAYPEPRRSPAEWAKGGWQSYLEWMNDHKFLGAVTSVLSVIMLLVLVASLVGTSLVSLLGGGVLGG